MAWVPKIRITPCNRAIIRSDGQYVLYWMIANRRPHWNFSLDRAVQWAEQLGQPVVVFEALRVGYKWASDRLHAFILQGMADNAEAFDESPIAYYPYVEREEGDGSGLLEELTKKASVVVTDDFPCFFLPRMVSAVAERLDVRFEKVDGNGLMPMRVADKTFARAYDFRRFLQRELANHLGEKPSADPCKELSSQKKYSLPKDLLSRWPKATKQDLDPSSKILAKFPIDHEVGIVSTRGGHQSAGDRLAKFLSDRLESYNESRNDPAEDSTSGLSPYLHFGHVSSHQVFDAIAEQEDWTPAKLSKKASGKREGWWGMSPASEEFLDQLVTWREIGYNTCHREKNYDKYESLPDWARTTLQEHADDKRPDVYPLEAFESAETHDPLWNAAQNQLRRDGMIHNYLRMLWGKKILHWSKSPEESLEIMIELNNKYALDGRNPNSYSGIFWTLGRYDRAWGPEREIFGKIRYMTSDSTARKYHVDGYIEKYAS